MLIESKPIKIILENGNIIEIIPTKNNETRSNSSNDVYNLINDVKVYEENKLSDEVLITNY